MVALCGPCKNGKRGTATMTQAQLSDDRVGSGVRQRPHEEERRRRDSRPGQGDEDRDRTDSPPAPPPRRPATTRRRIRTPRASGFAASNRAQSPHAGVDRSASGSKPQAIVCAIAQPRMRSRSRLRSEDEAVETPAQPRQGPGPASTSSFRSRIIAKGVNSRSAAIGFGSITSHGSRALRRTLPAWRSSLASTSGPCVGPSSRSASTAASSSERSNGRPVRCHCLGSSSTQRSGHVRQPAEASEAASSRAAAGGRPRRRRRRRRRARSAASRARQRSSSMRVPLGVFVEQPNGAVAVPGAKRVGLVLRLLVGRSDLQHGVARGSDERARARRARRSERRVPSARRTPRRAAGAGRATRIRPASPQVVEVSTAPPLIFRAIVRASPRMSSAATLPFAPAA